MICFRGGMVSQGSDCDSDGLLRFTQGGYEDNEDAMEMIQARREVDD